MRFFGDTRYMLSEFVERNRGPALFLATLFVIGVIFGALSVRSLDGRDKQELVQYISTNFAGLPGSQSGTGVMLLRRSLMGSLQMLALLWVLGLSVIGGFGVMLILLLRGFVTGFVVAFLTAEMGATGLLIALSGHVPQSIIEVPALLLAATVALSFSAQVVRAWREQRRVRNFYPALRAYTGTLLSVGSLFILVALVESYLSPVVLRMVMTWLQQG